MDKRITDPVRKCTVCSCEFDLDAEGGIEGNFGILPVAFCPTCLACMHSMVEQMTQA